MPSKQEILNEARLWVGTRFHHQGRIKKTHNNKGGCDCIGLIIGVCENLKITGNNILLSDLDRNDYSMEPDGILLKNTLDQNLREISLSDLSPADILLFRFNKDPQHVGIVSDYGDGELGIIHCYAQAKGVVEHSLDENWRGKIVSAYRF